MESYDRELIERALENNFEIKKLYSQHKDFDARLQKLARQRFLTRSEEEEERKLKRLKLRGVERMLRLASA